MDKEYLSLMDKEFIVIRNEVIKDPLTNTVKGSKDEIYGPYLCRLGRATGAFIQANPQGIVIIQQTLYTLIDVVLKEGDIAVIDGKNYTVGNVYKPGNHHVEAEVKYEGDA